MVSGMGVGVGYLRESHPQKTSLGPACRCNSLNTCQHTVTHVRWESDTQVSERMCYVCMYVRGEVSEGCDVYHSALGSYWARTATEKLGSACGGTMDSGT